jgi:hypothetical protein
MPSAARLADGLAERLLAAMRARRLRDTVRRMETIEALHERVLDRFEALGPTELKCVADPVPLFRAVSS